MLLCVIQLLTYGRKKYGRRVPANLKSEETRTRFSRRYAEPNGG